VSHPVDSMSAHFSRVGMRRNTSEPQPVLALNCPHGCATGIGLGLLRGKGWNYNWASLLKWRTV
jgi:hypothetical protein